MSVLSVPDTLQTDEHLAAQFARQAEPHFAVLSRGSRRLTRNAADAEDLLQDTLLHAYAGFRSFQEGSNLRAWLFRILYNRWVSTHRARQSRPSEISADELTERDVPARSAEAEVLDVLPDHDIKVAFAALPVGFREAMYYADIEGYTYAETAAILGVPQGTVMSRASRGRQRLRIALAHLAPSATDEPLIA
jgi:RNA polymerase sigma-70 factor (ECF subfamily)